MIIKNNQSNSSVCIGNTGAIRPTGAIGPIGPIGSTGPIGLGFFGFMKEIKQNIFENKSDNNLLNKTNILDTCSICLEDCDTFTKCNHYLHNDCLEKWLSEGKNNSCPNCREELL